MLDGTVLVVDWAGNHWVKFAARRGPLSPEPRHEGGCLWRCFRTGKKALLPHYRNNGWCWNGINRAPMDLTPTPIIRRRVNIEFDPAKARGWHLNRKDREDFLNAVSFLFPPGEKFFIQSVQNYQDRITEPVLKEQVKRFIYQEAMHTKEHIRCNLALNQTFPNGHKIEEFATAMLARNRRFAPKVTQLACTCALEHFTAILADNLLRMQERFLSDSDPAFAALWLWHAVEETEHKAVCFDVYQQVSGKGVLSYLHRVISMFAITVVFIFALFVAFRQLEKGKKDQQDNRATAGPGNGPASRNSAGRPGLWHLLKETISMVQKARMSRRLYFDYYRPSFHPWDHNNAHLIEEWKQRYRDFGAGPDAAPSDART
jgi:uncharacterized protein